MAGVGHFSSIGTSDYGRDVLCAVVAVCCADRVCDVAGQLSDIDFASFVCAVVAAVAIARCVFPEVSEHHAAPTC